MGDIDTSLFEQVLVGSRDQEIILLEARIGAPLMSFTPVRVLSLLA